MTRGEKKVLMLANVVMDWACEEREKECTSLYLPYECSVDNWLEEEDDEEEYE